MPHSAGTLFELILSLTWAVLSMTPTRGKHPLFDRILSSPDDLNVLLASTSPSFAPGLFDVLQASNSPTLAFFKSLPTDWKMMWAVYLLVLEKPGSRPRIYIGSGTEARYSVSVRLSQYNTGQIIPRYVKAALDDGYTITSKGTICSAPIPAAALVPTTRLLFMALEAAFTFIFWAVRCNTECGHGMVDMCLWARESLTYDGLCSHSPLMESPAGDFSLSAEELEAVAAEFVRRRAQYMKDYHATVKNNDPDKYLALKREERRKYVARHPDGAKAADKRCMKKAVEEKTHYCAACDHAFTKKAKLTRHLTGPKHAAKVAKAAGVKKHHCAVCDHTFNRAADLTRHLASSRHAAKAALLAASGI